jgi:hypothetical protein
MSIEKVKQLEENAAFVLDLDGLDDAKIRFVAHQTGTELYLQSESNNSVLYTTIVDAGGRDTDYISPTGTSGAESTSTEEEYSQIKAAILAGYPESDRDLFNCEVKDLHQHQKDRKRKVTQEIGARTTMFKKGVLAAMIADPEIEVLEVEKEEVEKEDVDGEDASKPTDQRINILLTSALTLAQEYDPEDGGNMGSIDITELCKCIEAARLYVPVEEE